jgi:nucleoside 2-deoxyribosyltransferase
MPAIYLAGPIDLVLPGQKSKFFDELKQELANDPDFAFYNPCEAFTLAKPEARKRFGVHHDLRGFIENVNNQAIGLADGFVGLFMREVATIGTPIELERAVHLGKPCWAVTDIRWGHSVYLSNRVNAERYHETSGVTSAEYTFVQQVAESIRKHYKQSWASARAPGNKDDPDNHEYD